MCSLEKKKILSLLPCKVTWKLLETFGFCETRLKIALKLDHIKLKFSGSANISTVARHTYFSKLHPTNCKYNLKYIIKSALPRKKREPKTLRSNRKLRWFNNCRAIQKMWVLKDFLSFSEITDRWTQKLRYGTFVKISHSSISKFCPLLWFADIKMYDMWR